MAEGRFGPAGAASGEPKRPGFDEARLQAEILERVTDGVNVVSAQDGRLVYTNPAFDAMFGYAAGELVGQPASVLNAPEAGSPEATALAIIAALHEAERWEGELLNRRKDGSTFRTHATITSHDLPGWGPAWISIQRDITERRRMEAALHEREQQLAAIAISTPDNVLVQDAALRYTMILNPQLGMTAEGIIGKTDFELLTPADAERVTALKREVLATGRPVRVELPLVSPSGATELFSGTYVARFDAAGRPDGIIGYFENVTEARRAEQALRTSQATLQGLYDSSPMMMGVAELVDGQTVAVSGNAAVLEFLAIQAAELTGKTGPELGNPSGFERLLAESYRRSQAEGKPVRFESEYARAAGVSWLSVTVAFIGLGPAGHPRFSFVAEDVTERRQAEARRLADMARQRDALVREVHHRIKNHLHGVAGLLRLQSDAHPELAPHLGDVIGQVNAIAGVYGLQSAGDGLGADLDRMVRLIVAGAALPVDYQGLPESALPLGDSDAVPIALVVNELITNASKHRQAVDPARPVRVTLQRAGDDVLLAVSAGPARLPPGFDYAARRGLGTGLELITTLLPSTGTALAFFQDGDEVRAELRLDAHGAGRRPDA